MSKDRACDVFTGTVASTINQLTLQASVASAVLRLFIVSLILSLFSIVAYAQGVAHSNTAWISAPILAASGINGSVLQPLPGASIYVCSGSILPASGTTCAPTTTVYSNVDLTSVITQPIIADQQGNYNFFASAGVTYIVSVTGSNAITYSYFWTAPVTPGANNAFTGNNTHSGTETFTGPISLSTPSNALNTWSLLNPGVWTDTQQNDYITSNINGCNIGTLFGSQQASHRATEAIAGCVNGVAGNVHQANGIAGYAVANTAGPTNNYVGVYGTSTATVNSARSWGGNVLVAENVGVTSDWLQGFEIDMNSQSTGQNVVNGLIISGASTAISALSNAIGIGAPDGIGTIHWGTGITVGNGGAVVGIALGATALPAASLSSQPINLTSYSPASVKITSGISADPFGDFVFTSNGGSLGSIVTGGSFVPSTAGNGNFGSAALPGGSLFIGGAATNNFKITGTATAARVFTLPDTASDTFTMNAATETLTNKTLTSPALTTPTIGGGTTLTKYSRFSVSLSPALVAANTCAAQSFTVTGIAAADILIAVSKPTEQAGLSVGLGHVTGANTATVNFCNNTAAGITPTAAETYQFVAVQ